MTRDDLWFFDQPDGLYGTDILLNRDAYFGEGAVLLGSVEIVSASPHVLFVVQGTPGAFGTAPSNFQFFTNVEMTVPAPVLAGFSHFQIPGVGHYPEGDKDCFAYLYVVENSADHLYMIGAGGADLGLSGSALVGIDGLEAVGASGQVASEPALIHDFAPQTGIGDGGLWVYAVFSNTAASAKIALTPTPFVKGDNGVYPSVGIGGAGEESDPVRAVISENLDGEEAGMIFGFVQLLSYVPEVPAEPQTIILSSAVSGPIAPGPRVRAPDEVVPPISVRILSRENPYSVVGAVTLDQSFGRTWQDQISEPGAGAVQLDNRDPDLALITDDTLLRFELNGDAQFMALAVDREQVTVAPGEEADQVTTISGPGHLASLGDAVVYPSRGVGSLPIEEDRVFSWPSPDFDDESWGHATALMSVDDARELWPSIPFGEGFPEDSGAQVVWAPAEGAVGEADFTHPEGDCYFRATIDVPTSGRVVVYALIDNFGEIYFDGQPILVVSPSDGFSTVSSFGLDVSMGEHTVAVRGHNSEDDLEPGYNPGAVAIAIYDADINNQPVSSHPIWVTDASMKIVAYPPSPPGMTPGRVVEILMAEATTFGRDALPPLMFLMFDEDVDSNGNPWPEVGEIATKVGTDYLTFLREMSGTYFDMWMAPAGFELYLFSLGGQGVDTAIDWHPPSDEDDPASGNLEHLTHLRRQ